jgi:hypothetical protein
MTYIAARPVAGQPHVSDAASTDGVDGRDGPTTTTPPNLSKQMMAPSEPAD